MVNSSQSFCLACTHSGGIGVSIRDLELLGHSTQILHILVVGAMVYVSTRFPSIWTGVFWLLVLASNIMSTCPLTALSNFFFGRAGHKQFASLLLWAASFVGVVPALALLITCVVALPFWLGYCARSANG